MPAILSFHLFYLSLLTQLMGKICAPCNYSSKSFRGLENSKRQLGSLAGSYDALLVGSCVYDCTTFALSHSHTLSLSLSLSLLHAAGPRFRFLSLQYCTYVVRLYNQLTKPCTNKGYREDNSLRQLQLTFGSISEAIIPVVKIGQIIIYRTMSSPSNGTR